MGDQHDQHPYGYKKGDKSDYFFHLWKAPPPNHFIICGFPADISGNKEVSANNCCKFMAIFIVFPGFCLKQLQQLFSDNSYTADRQDLQ